MSMTPRDEMVELQKQIDVLNSRKASWQKAYEIEKEKDPDYPMPEELRAFNKQLGPLYGLKDALLEEHPELAGEFGGKKKRKENTPTGFAARTAAMQLGDQQRAARNAKKKDVPQDFWEFCRTAQPQIRQNMDSWEDTVVRSRYEQWLSERDEKAKREEKEAKEIAERVKKDREERDRIVAEQKQKELDEKCGEIPVAFSGDFLSYMEKSFSNQGVLLKFWEDKEYRGLYELWLEEKQKSSAA